LPGSQGQGKAFSGKQKVLCPNPTKGFMPKWMMGEVQCRPQTQKQSTELLTGVCGLSSSLGEGLSLL